MFCIFISKDKKYRQMGQDKDDQTMEASYLI